MTIGAWLKPQYQILCLVTIYTFLYSSFLSFTNTTFWICCDFYIINYLCILHSIISCITFHLFSCRYHLFLQYLNSDILKIFYIWFTCQVIPLYLSAFMLGVILELYWCPSWRKPKYLLKSLKSCLWNKDALSLLAHASMPSEAKVWLSLGITALALVELTNSTSTHLNCFHTVTSSYSPVQVATEKVKPHLSMVPWQMRHE